MRPMRPRAVIALNIASTLFSILMIIVGIKAHNILAAFPLIFTVHIMTLYKTCMHIRGNYRVIYVTHRDDRTDVKVK